MKKNYILSLYFQWCQRLWFMPLFTTEERSLDKFSEMGLKMKWKGVTHSKLVTLCVNSLNIKGKINHAQLMTALALEIGGFLNN